MAPFSQTSAVRKAVRQDSATELRHSQSSESGLAGTRTQNQRLRDGNAGTPNSTASGKGADFTPVDQIIVAMAVAKPF